MAHSMIDHHQGIMEGGCVIPHGGHPHNPHFPTDHHNTGPFPPNEHGHYFPPPNHNTDNGHGPFYFGETNGHPVYGGLLIPYHGGMDGANGAHTGSFVW